MTDFAAIEGDAFRREVRQWLADNFPPSLKNASSLTYQTNPDEARANADFCRWKTLMGESGMGVPTWPKQYGGAGLSTEQAEVFQEEMSQLNAFNPIFGNGPMMLGPTLLEFGTEEQKLEHLPVIARGESSWCQGFSEPGAGSDLASLKTKCEDKGDHWLVNGQKVWTSFANHSDWCFCLVRTDTSVKHTGISFLLIDMTSPGIDVRPIELISGITHFCEVFFNDVKVPKANLLGQLNEGWSIAKRLLQHERNGLSNVRRAGPDVVDLAKEYVGVDEKGQLVDPDLRCRLTTHQIRSQAYKLTLKRISDAENAGVRSDIAVSVVKNLGACVEQSKSELSVEILGYRGLGWEAEGYSDEELAVTRAWLYSKAFSIYGGSHEIQNNITAKRVLNLPSAK